MVYGLIILVLMAFSALATPRPAAVAGQFYPDNTKELHNTVVHLLENAPPLPLKGTIKAIVVPHAGYSFSAPTAAIAYRQVAHLHPKRILLLGPGHFADIGHTVALSSADSWQTPLGNVAVDTKLRDRLLKEASYMKINDQAHAREHSLEVQLPFIQTLFPRAKIVPMVINSLDRAKDLALVLKKYLTPDTLLIISTDMSHYHPLTAAQEMDHRTMKAMVDQDLKTLRQGLQDESMEMCGRAAVMAMMELIHHMGAMEITPLKYDTSGKRANDQSVVGYFSAAITRPQEYDALLAYAHKVLAYHVKTGKEDAPFLAMGSDFFTKPTAAFITLRTSPEAWEVEGKLRGCIGSTTPQYPLKEAIRQFTMAAASQDSRFPPVTMAELPHIQIQLSLLTPAKVVSSFQSVVFGKHGVILSQGKHSGVFLPEVADSFATKKAFLEELCTQKAHLPATCYQDPSTKIQVFESLAFQ